VLLLGATGTGKEVAARHLHAESGRTGRFVAVNCPALPAQLVEAELFGSRKGAYTDAKDDRAGLIEAADGGTLLLDEIGDLPLGSQAKLLRVLEEGAVKRVGDTRERDVDVRFVAATNHDLRERASDGRFRDDLYARLTGFTLRLPPLGDRREDLGILVAHLLALEAGDRGPPAIEADAYRRLMTDRWRLNVRGLAHALHTAAVLARGENADAIGAAHLQIEDAPPKAAEVAARAGDAPAGGEDERGRLGALLDKHDDNVSAAAHEHGVSRQHFHRLLKKHGLR
jgi:DNA-binding NtrC family response regulator